jgi:glycosyltransferase involved in cell wall biosynthesis
VTGSGRDAAQPRLSVLTASRNRRELLLAKLASLRRQTLPAGNFEWVICLDGATDGSAGALRRELAARPARFSVTILETEGSEGAGAARNRCAEAARGETLYLSDDDCLLLPGTLERHLEAQSAPAVVLGAITFRSEGGLDEWQVRRPRYWHVNGANTSLPAAAFTAAGGFPAWLGGYGGEDIMLGFLLGRAGLPLRAIGDAGVIHEGANTAAGSDPQKSRQAGSNAARIALRYPETAGRLGVARWQLALKRPLLPLLGLLGPRGRAEAAYARGAISVRKDRDREDRDRERLEAGT